MTGGQRLTPTVDLSALDQQTDIVIRAGDPSVPTAKAVMIRAYPDADKTYPDAVGLSTVFRQGASLDELARAANFPHGKIGFATISRLVSALRAVGYEPVLFVTPTVDLPDHHSLAVRRILHTTGHLLVREQDVEVTLPEAAADALLRALTVMDNPYRAPRHP